LKPVVDFISQHWRTLLTPAAVLFATLAGGWFGKRLLFRILRQWAARTATRFDDLLIMVIQGPFMLWVLILGVHLAAQWSELPIRATAFVDKTLLVLWIVSLTVAGSRLAGALIRHYGGGLNGALPVTTITQNISSLVVVTVGLLVLLNTLGISITPILTALGVGGLAVALALQDTLSNLFAGFYVSLAGQVRAGDYVRLDTGQEGYVTDITWRSTTLRALSDNLIVVPNAKLAGAILTNYSLPEKHLSVSIQIGVSFESDTDQVERVLIEEAKAGAGDIPGLLSEPAPSVRFIPGFGESSLGFTLNCQVGEFAEQYAVQSELRRRILKRFRREGIEIPFPIRTVHIQSQSSALLPSTVKEALR
jgi:small-conductance mechanosensitive channel